MTTKPVRNDWLLFFTAVAESNSSMKNISSFYGILILASVIGACKLIGNIFGAGIYTGIFFISAAVIVLGSLIYSVSKDR
jgi:hypothetical protein